MGAVRVQYLGGPTALLEVAGTRLLIDPTFDPPGRAAAAASVACRKPTARFPA